MDWNIPRISAEPVQLTLEIGDRVFIVGPNGSGKSALLQNFVSSHKNDKIRRISAHRQTWFNSGSIDLSPHSRGEFKKTIWDGKPDSIHCGKITMPT